jgi:hypothetical protein
MAVELEDEPSPLRARRSRRHSTPGGGTDLVKKLFDDVAKVVFASRSRRISLGAPEKAAAGTAVPFVRQDLFATDEQQAGPDTPPRFSST